jgi:hypothetical protein
MKNVLFLLIRAVICGTVLTEEDKNRIARITGEDAEMRALCILAKKHDMLHIVAEALLQNGLLAADSPYYAKLYREKMLAVFRYERLQHEYEQLAGVLNRAEIPFIPMKGAVIRAYYPAPWLRTSCDLDILVREEDRDRAAERLSQELGWHSGRPGAHDLALTSTAGSHIELHYQLMEEGYLRRASAVLTSVWERSEMADGALYRMSDEMYYCYHIAHMVKHVELGGCGVRPFLDLWILENRMHFDSDKRDALLAEGGLLDFAKVARRLAAVWFDGAEHDHITAQLETYIFEGGVFGVTKNRVSLQQAKQGGKAGYILSRIFLDYDVLKFYYPVLQKHKGLYPLYLVRWLFRCVFRRRVLSPERMKKFAKEIKLNSKTKKSEVEETKRFMREIGLGESVHRSTKNSSK